MLPVVDSVIDRLSVGDRLSEARDLDSVGVARLADGVSRAEYDAVDDFVGVPALPLCVTVVDGDAVVDVVGVPALPLRDRESDGDGVVDLVGVLSDGDRVTPSVGDALGVRLTVREGDDKNDTVGVGFGVRLGITVRVCVACLLQGSVTKFTIGAHSDCSSAMEVSFHVLHFIRSVGRAFLSAPVAFINVAKP